MKKIAIIGGGAAGFFTAANLGKELGSQTVLFEQSSAPLQKVSVSGGGRCNVTHACFDPKELVEFYPRGKKELRSVFHQFQPGDTMEWFESRKVPLKIEDDNRIFPVSDNSMSIIECLMNETEKNLVEIKLSETVQKISKKEHSFLIETKSGSYKFETVIFTPGSSNKSMEILRNLGHGIVKPIPSLFTFNIKDKRLKDLMGISFEWAEISIPQIKMEAEGPMLITHWGLSGPGILRLSAWGAIELNRLNYEFEIKINFVQKEYEACCEFLNEFKLENGKKSVYKINPFGFPKRFWQRILEITPIPTDLTYSHLTKNQLEKIASELTKGIYQVKGKSTFKEEFVTAGGVDLKEINFKKMESKIVPNLFIAGEILNIDAITGGFNFQACWSEGFIISETLKNEFL
ncbi:BaiN/RdsA family NAD(P)/FAD-dependent oxidoreductase [Moheibacter lacus]|uniref:NAD(P)/FAD-dependent oxidoreductase n=1 Tax=Moheibacter lacus TaxID=2745851 RepID=A0A838ZJ64_9FLAO|nr:NAD(P)/FAD-dependent oxidoreductase [Moheibacter lacus]MBA5629298.1 NAD(P)/FAD-dependent oxidoreductase [Moheibacter lacus]